MGPEKWIKAVCLCLKYIVFKTCRGLKRVLLPSGYWDEYNSSFPLERISPCYTSLYRPATWFSGSSAKLKYEILARDREVIVPLPCAHVPNPQQIGPTGISSPMHGHTWCLNWEFPHYKYQVENSSWPMVKPQAYSPCVGSFGPHNLSLR